MPEPTAGVALFALTAVVSAVFFTIALNPKDAGPGKLIKFLGIFFSTMPIIGVIQGAIVGSRDPGYSKSCYWQAGVGAIAYVLGIYVFKLGS